MLQRVFRSPLVLWGIPSVAVVGSYLWLAWDHGTSWLWGVRVHESGAYSLGQTVLYFRHFLREVPVDVAYALFLVAAAGRPSDPEAPVDVPPKGTRRPLLPVVLAAGLLVVAVTAAVQEAGLGSALLDLGQFRTRDDLVAYGSHWRFHWLSTIWFGLAVSALADPVLGPGRGARRPRRTTWFVAWGYVALLTLVFGVSPEIFTDVRYAGHQAREIATHGAVTLFVGFGILRVLDGGAGRARPQQTASGADGHERHQLLAAALLALIPAYLAVVMLRADVMEVAQSEQGLSAMVAGHLFEHSLDYVLVGLLTVVGYGWVASFGARQD
jgi:hypothetical protein